MAAAALLLLAGGAAAQCGPACTSCSGTAATGTCLATDCTQLGVACDVVSLGAVTSLARAERAYRGGSIGTALPRLTPAPRPPRRALQCDDTGTDCLAPNCKVLGIGCLDCPDFKTCTGFDCVAFGTACTQVRRRREGGSRSPSSRGPLCVPQLRCSQTLAAPHHHPRPRRPPRPSTACSAPPPNAQRLTAPCWTPHALSALLTRAPASPATPLGPPAPRECRSCFNSSALTCVGPARRASSSCRWRLPGTRCAPPTAPQLLPPPAQTMQVRREPVPHFQLRGPQLAVH